MIETRAIVDEVDDQNVRLLITPGTTCTPCIEGRGCGAALWSRKRVLTLPRSAVPPDTVPGKQLSLRCNARDIRLAAITGYGIPLAGLLAGASVASLSGAGDALTAVSGLAGVLIATLAARFLTRGSKRPNLVIH
ncbi:MAG: SoxR reducing system RseC family protein [Pseudomonadota bacterium]